MHTIANFSRTTRIVLIIAAFSAAATRLSFTAAPENVASDIEAVHVAFVATQMHVENAETATAAATPVIDDMPHVVITGKRMTSEEKAVFDAKEEAYASMQLGFILLP